MVTPMGSKRIREPKNRVDLFVGVDVLTRIFATGCCTLMAAADRKRMVECIATDLATQAIMRGSGRFTETMMSKFVFRWLRSVTSIAAIVGLLTTAVQGQPADQGADFTGTYEFVGPLLAIGPCDGVINGKWETRCTNYPYNDAGRHCSARGHRQPAAWSWNIWPLP